MTLPRRCRDCHQTFTPPVEQESAIQCPSCIQDYIDSQMFDDEDCGQCDGSGYTYDCIDGCCANPEDGCRLCERRCDFCNPPTPQQVKAGDEIRQVLADALNKPKPE